MTERYSKLNIEATINTCRDMGMGYTAGLIEHLQAALTQSQAELAEARRLYDELLYGVGKKHPDESRHETALRYIRSCENPKDYAGKQGTTHE